MLAPTRPIALRTILARWSVLALVAAHVASCANPPPPRAATPAKTTTPGAAKSELVRRARAEAVAPLPPHDAITLCLVIDRSGSMDESSKLEQVKAAAITTARALAAHDRIAVVSFGDTAELVLPPTPGGDSRAIAAALESLGSGGHTAMFRALALSHEVMREQKTPIRHVVLVTDGMTTDDGIWRDLLNAMTAEGITVSTVGIGLDVDAPKLARLAQWGNGRYWLAQPHEVRQVVAQDTRRAVEGDAIDERQYRRQVEELARELGVEVPTWQMTWKARLESLQYLKRKQTGAGQSKEEVVEDWNDWYDRREKLVEDWEAKHLGWLQIAADKGREWLATVDPLKDFEAAGLADSDNAKVLRARQARLQREGEDAGTRYEDGRAVVTALRAAEPPENLDALVTKVLAEWQAKGPEERQKLRERELERAGAPSPR